MPVKPPDILNTRYNQYWQETNLTRGATTVIEVGPSGRAQIVVKIGNEEAKLNTNTVQRLVRLPPEK